MFHLPTIRAYTQAVAIMEQKVILQTVFADMEEVWLSLHTPDKKCPILEEIGTNVKRRLVRQYTIRLIKHMRGTIGLDLVSKVIDSDNAFWSADDIVLRVADGVVENHFSMFRSLINAIFGLSIKIIDFMFKETTTKNDLYGILGDFYDLDIDDVDIYEEITLEWLTERFNEYLEEPSLSIFTVRQY